MNTIILYRVKLYAVITKTQYETIQLIRCFLLSVNAHVNTFFPISSVNSVRSLPIWKLLNIRI